ncbi:hypothetical protein GCM10027347_58890 [Larkinella harenae]
MSKKITFTRNFRSYRKDSTAVVDDNTAKVIIALGAAKLTSVKGDSAFTKPEPITVEKMPPAIETAPVLAETPPEAPAELDQKEESAADSPVEDTAPVTEQTPKKRGRPPAEKAEKTESGKKYKNRMLTSESAKGNE